MFTDTSLAVFPPVPLAPGPDPARRPAPSTFLEGTKGSQGLGVVSNNGSDRLLLSILYRVRALMLTDVQTPFLGTPLLPLKTIVRDLHQLISALLAAKSELHAPVALNHNKSYSGSIQNHSYISKGI